MATSKRDFDIVPPSLAVKAMRDSGYRNAAYAIAELVDNAVQAKAKIVEILCQEEEEFVSQRTRIRVKQIAVLDNGKGMSSDVLRKALQFGNGERLDDREGIGRFGMGLPNSSISQARRVDVWSWQDGCSKAVHTYLDIDEIERGEMDEVPACQRKSLPKEWRERSATAADSISGTLVVWSQLDKCDWRTADAIFKNSEYTIGRIYRRFLLKKALRIRMAAFLGNSFVPRSDDNVAPNDPLYLTPNPTLPPPWDTTPMFEQYGDQPTEIAWKKGGRDYVVKITYSVAKKEARAGHNAGDLPHGKHAKNNTGVSIVRANRELELQQTGWCNQYDPRERWWGVEVDFPPALDEIFGVTNNKQSARALAEFASLDVDQIAEREGYKSETELAEAWEDDNDPRIVLLRVKKAIENNLGFIRGIIKSQATPRRTRHEKDPNSAENVGTEAIRKRQQEGYHGTSDVGEKLPETQKTAEIKDLLTEGGVDPADAAKKAEQVVGSGYKFEFYNIAVDTPEFFSVRPRGGAILIGLNTTHPAYDHLVTLLEEGDEETDLQSMKLRFRQAYEGLKLLLEAWARYEDELTDGVRKQRAQDARLEWGRVARQFFRED